MSNRAGSVPSVNPDNEPVWLGSRYSYADAWILAKAYAKLVRENQLLFKGWLVRVRKVTTRRGACFGVQLERDSR